MTDFRFEADGRFPQHCDAFLDEITALDPELGKVLCNNWDALLEVVKAGARSSDARRRFNLAVVAALDLLVDSAEPEGSP